MSSEVVQQNPHSLDKGKARANNHEPTETTPLLASRSYIIPPDDDILETISQSQPSLFSTLTSVFLLTLSISILLVLLLLSLAYSYAAKASRLSNDDIINNGLVFRGPDAIDVLNITEDGEVWLRLNGRIGFDAGAIMGVKPDHDDNFLLDAWKVIGRWGIRSLDIVSVTLSSVNITSPDDPEAPLASIDVPPFQIPISANPSDDFAWLSPISVPAHINPSHNVSAWFKFFRESWRRGYAVTQATLARAEIQGGVLQGWTWKNAIKIDRSNVTLGLRVKIPIVPGLPAPESGLPLPAVSELVHLANFSLTSSSNNLFIDAAATMTNPIPSAITFTAPPLPFIVWTPSSPDADDSLIPLATVTSESFTLTHPNITLSLHGRVLPIPPPAAPGLSSLISDYLSGVDHPISVTSPLKFFADYIAHTKFPSKHPRPEILRNVTIESMKIHPSGTTILANGVVHARIALPEGMDVTLHVSRVLPDALIFDGPLPKTSIASLTPTLPIKANNLSNLTKKDDDDDAPPPLPLPSPLPPRAFARVRPSSWLTALSAPTEPRRDWNEGGSTTLRVSAWFADIPLEVLPGREREFRSFVGKVIFGGGDGAVAGVQGVAAVGVRVEGLPIGEEEGEEGEEEGEGEARVSGGVVLTGLPFHGNLRVGRKGVE
ncbi:hypothetical protein B0F90DRAFT_1646621 [Multifurca ochricompacta]|uniref:Transmembrane protein n=1 Tax=Multifurca ochricompacta TaxID=376703 RepID=A0AAD4LY15_9AGAM|nr:hypothetical protein B0F90DRAFT_1646621 [Multifurca ochricompacta]